MDGFDKINNEGDMSNNNGSTSANQQADVKEKKPEATSAEHINLKVISADNSEVMFKIKRKTKLEKLMMAYCSRAGKSYGTVRFLVDGERINGDNTPDDLNLDDGDTIDAMTEQIGGSC